MALLTLHLRRGDLPSSLASVWRVPGSAVLLCFAVFPSLGPAPAQAMSFEERVSCRGRVEDVYWAHRLWPQQNPEPKPPRSTVLSDAEIAQEMDASLRYEAALEQIWQSGLTAQLIQAEMDRIIRHSKQPQVLAELIQALASDPREVAECLVRPELAERRIRSLYANDERLHGEVRARAEQELAAARNLDDLQNGTGTVSEMEWVLRGPNQHQRHDAHRVFLDEGEWNERVRMVAREFAPRRSRPLAAPALQLRSADSSGLPLGSLSALREDQDRYFAWVLVGRGESAVRVATVAWRKRPFSDWWKATRAQVVRADPVPADYSLSALAEVDATTESWTVIPGSFVPDPRTGHLAVWTGSEMIVWGGFNGFASISAGRYSPATDSWSPISEINQPAAGTSAVWTGSEMIVWGGFDSNGGFARSGSRYNPLTDRWATMTINNAPSGRYAYTVVWTGREMVIWGGTDNQVYLATGGRYRPSTDTWLPVTTRNAPSARRDLTGVWTGREMIVWGGLEFRVNGYVNTGGRYDPATDRWTEVSNHRAPLARAGHSAIWTGREMIVWGGVNPTPPSDLDTGGRYDPATDHWAPTTTSNAPSGRSSHTAIWTGREMIVWGGWSLLRNAFETGGRYRPATNEWIATATENAPAGRVGHTAVWTGSEMIIWGGSPDGSDEPFNNDDRGGRYRPSTDSWVATGLMSAPSPRDRHTAVWTGIEMIIWGGSAFESGAGGSGFDTGSRYLPVTDSWMATASLGAPIGRVDHTAVWTGREMIVWGGSSSDRSGGRYDPLTDHWSATSTHSAPEPRFGHTAVWTGREMIVWGGTPDVGGLDSGGRYDPVTDSWQATTFVGAPAARFGHSAVWTGSEMIVWGGADLDFDCNTLDFNDGGRYSPASDQWVQTSTVNAPAGRYDHSAVWTGTEMIVWGGSDADGGIDALVAGGRYQPVTNSWVATARDAAPSGRIEHTALWTGREMIVWGGTDGITRRRSGGRYDPDTDRWTATTKRAAPSARSLHTAIWTGDAMLVWGGVESDAPFGSRGDGGLYHPPG